MQYRLLCCLNSNVSNKHMIWLSNNNAWIRVTLNFKNNIVHCITRATCWHVTAHLKKCFFWKFEMQWILNKREDLDWILREKCYYKIEKRTWFILQGLLKNDFLWNAICILFITCLIFWQDYRKMFLEDMI